MAVTSIWPVSGRVKSVIDYARNPEKTREKDAEALAALHQIDGVIQYAADEMKTETRAYVSCLNCTSEEKAAEEFMATKDYYDKTGGRQCFHGYQSFAAGEVDAETAHRIGVELAKRLWGDRFQVLIATHCNTGHYHNHFVLNSVSDVDGRHFDNTQADYRRMREESDRLCREYGLSVIENPGGHGKNYGERQAEKTGKPTLRGMIRADIDRAVAASLTAREFYQNLADMGYEFKFQKSNGEPLEHPGLKPTGAKGFYRFYKLGKGYDVEDIEKRIVKNMQRQYPFPEAEDEAVREYRRRSPPPSYKKGSSSLHRLYLRYCYELHIIEKHPTSAKRLHHFLREDLIKLDRLDAQTLLLAKHQISTYEELDAYRANTKHKIEKLTDERNELRNVMRNQKRHNEPETAEQTKKQIAVISRKLRELRKEIDLCNEISIRSARTREELEYVLAQQEEIERKENSNDELFRRRGGTGRENEPGRY